MLLENLFVIIITLFFRKRYERATKMQNMENSINEKVKQAIATKLGQLFKESKLIAKEDGKIIEIKSIKGIQILNCEKLNSIMWKFNEGRCNLEIEMSGDASMENPYHLSGEAIIHLKLDEEQEVQIEKVEIVDNTISVSKYIQ